MTQIRSGLLAEPTHNEEAEFRHPARLPEITQSGGGGFQTPTSAFLRSVFIIGLRGLKTNLLLTWIIRAHMNNGPYISFTDAGDMWKQVLMVETKFQTLI